MTRSLLLGALLLLGSCGDPPDCRQSGCLHAEECIHDPTHPEKGWWCAVPPPPPME